MRSDWGWYIEIIANVIFMLAGIGLVAVLLFLIRVLFYLIWQ